MNCRHRLFTITLAVCALGAPAVAQQPGRGRGAAPSQTPQLQAPIDLTGWWVSVVTEDWRWRMVTPAKGDYASVPINQDARKAGDTWDLAKDEASGNACKPFGVGNIMRMPGRLQRGGERQVPGLEHRLHQRAAHAARGAGDRNPHRAPSVALACGLSGSPVVTSPVSCVSLPSSKSTVSRRSSVGSLCASWRQYT